MTEIVLALERQAKGVNVVGLVKMLRAHMLQHALPCALKADEEALLHSFVLPTTWYPFSVFIRLLRIAHQYVAGGGDEAAVEMGRRYARQMFVGMHRPYLHVDDPELTLASWELLWRGLFNFGALKTYAVDGVARITIVDYGDMSRVHGLIIAGIALESLAMAGAPSRHWHIVRAPWLGDRDFQLSMQWANPG